MYDPALWEVKMKIEDGGDWLVSAASDLEELAEADGRIVWTESAKIAMRLRQIHAELKGILAPIAKQIAEEAAYIDEASDQADAMSY